MKKYIFFITLPFLLSGCRWTTTVMEKPDVDERIELVSIVFRLAGNNEYNDVKFRLYTDLIKKHFEPYKSHELIAYAKKMRLEKSLSYDAPMSLAISLDEKLNPRLGFAESVAPRWNEADALEFVRLLKTFYKDADCETFFQNNADLYRTIAGQFSSVRQDLDLGWYTAFFGYAPTENFKIAIALGNGEQCYSSSYTNPEGKKDVYAVVGVWETDKAGMPIFDNAHYLPVILHEYNHSFVNPLLEKHKALFQKDGEAIFEMLNDEMRQQAYGNWETVLNEALVRASVIMYFKEFKKNSAIEAMYKEELRHGFLWIRELVAELEKYEANRSEYPTIDHYMPVLAEAYHSYAEIVAQYDAKKPSVVSIKEFENGSMTVDNSLKTITFNFDRPLSNAAYSVFYGEEGKEAFPDIENLYYSEDNRSFIMETKLDADKEYHFYLTGKSFKTSEGYSLKTYDVRFKTTK